MKPFTIACLTCGTTLKVHDASLIGQILMCAKCRSMVLVEAPVAADVAAEASASAVSAPALAAGSTPEPHDEDVAIAASTPVAPTIEPGDQLGSAVAAAPLATPSVGSEAESVEAPPPQPPATTSVAAMPLPAETGSSTVPTLPSVPQSAAQRWLVLAASASVGMMLVMGGWLFLRARQSNSPVPPNQIADATPAEPSVASINSSHQADDVDAGEPTTRPAPNSPADDTQPLAIATPIDPDASPPLNAGTSQDPPADAADKVESQDKPATATETPPQEAKQNDNPFLFPRIDDNGIASGETVKEILAAGEEPGETPAEAPRDQSPVEYPIPGPNPDIASRLEMSIEAIQFGGESLMKAAGLVSQMTSVPVQFDAVALWRLGASTRQPVHLTERDTTALELLDAMVRAWGLRPIATSDHVVVTVEPADQAAILERSYTVNDIANGSTELKQLALLVRQMLAPDTWSENGGAGTIEAHDDSLRVQQSAAVHRDLFMFCEKLRVARGLPGRSKLFFSEPNLFSLTSRTSRAAQALAEPASYASVPEISVWNFAEGLSHRCGIEITVDEMALLRAGVSPQVNVTYDGATQPLAKLLDAVLRPAGLTFRVIHDSLLQITTSHELTRTPDVEFYALDGLATRDGQIEPLLDRIRASVAPGRWSAAGTNSRMHYDEPSHHLIVLASQPVQQQLEAQLSAWRGK